MKITNNFPYEVTINKACDINLIENSEKQLVYEITIPQSYLDGLDPNMVFLIDNGYCELGAELNCSSTLYRKWFKASNKEKFKVNIDRKNVAGKFTLQVLVIANISLEENGVLLMKGMPIALLGDLTYSIEGESYPLFIFQEAQNDNITYNFDCDYIVIFLPKKHYQDLQIHKENPTISILLSSHFAQLALIESFKYFREDASHLDYNWYSELLNRWKDFRKTDEEFPAEEDYQDFINFILKDPSMTLVDHLISHLKSTVDDND